VDRGLHLTQKKSSLKENENTKNADQASGHHHALFVQKKRSVKDSKPKERRAKVVNMTEESIWESNRKRNKEGRSNKDRLRLNLMRVLLGWEQKEHGVPNINGSDRIGLKAPPAPDTIVIVTRPSQKKKKVTGEDPGQKKMEKGKRASADAIKKRGLRMGKIGRCWMLSELIIIKKRHYDPARAD